jgi:hypothetical protein
MCFSANASFGAGVVLTVIGVASIKKTQHRSQLLFASIPFLFGIQQLAEGVLWVTLPNPAYLQIQKIATYVYLFFAQVLWPIWVPFAILLVEKSETRNKIQWVLLGAGLMAGLYLGYCLLAFHVEAKIAGHHIMYLLDNPDMPQNYIFVLYGIASILPAFFSHIKHMWILGVSALVSYLVSAFFFEHYVLSVWCFFASIISLIIYAIMAEISKSEEQQPIIAIPTS